ALAPGDLVAQSLARFEPLAQDAGIALRGDAVSGLPSIEGDRARLLQVFDNLLTNALRHTAADGAISLSATNTGSSVRFVVASPAVLDAETAAHRFDRSWRADDARVRDASGSGLGLAITRQIVLLHGGAIRVEPADGETRFVIDLPAMKPAV